jgi:hypothetical protein
MYICGYSPPSLGTILDIVLYTHRVAMSLYEPLLRTTYTLRHRKGGGYYITVPSEDVKALKCAGKGMENARIEIAVLRTTAPVIDAEAKEE